MTPRGAPTSQFTKITQVLSKRIIPVRTGLMIMHAKLPWRPVRSSCVYAERRPCGQLSGNGSVYQILSRAWEEKRFPNGSRQFPAVPGPAGLSVARVDLWHHCRVSVARSARPGGLWASICSRRNQSRASRGAGGGADGPKSRTSQKGEISKIRCQNIKK